MEAQLAHDFSSADLHRAWNDILARTPAAHAQLTYEWLSSCWEVSNDNRKLSLITVTDRGKIVGIAPLIVCRVIDKVGLALRKLTFVGDGLTDYHDMLIANEKREEILGVLFERILEERDRWDTIHFRNIRGDSPNWPILLQILQETSLGFFKRVNVRSPYIVIDRDWADYYGTLSRKIRSDLRRRSRHLAEMGKVEYVRLCDVDDVTGLLDTIRSVHIKCRQAQGGTSWYADARRFRFASLVLERFGACKSLDLALLKLDDRVIAYYVGLIHDDVVYFWNTGFDPECARVSPGKLLLHYAIEDSFRRGYAGFDFMVGEEPYKLEWTSSVRPNYELCVFKNTVRSRLFKCYHVYKPLLKKNRYLRRIRAGMQNKIGA